MLTEPKKNKLRKTVALSEFKLRASNPKVLIQKYTIETSVRRENAIKNRILFAKDSGGRRSGHGRPLLRPRCGATPPETFALLRLPSLAPSAPTTSPWRVSSLPSPLVCPDSSPVTTRRGTSLEPPPRAPPNATFLRQKSTAPNQESTAQEKR